MSILHCRTAIIYVQQSPPTISSHLRQIVQASPPNGCCFACNASIPRRHPGTVESNLWCWQRSRGISRTGDHFFNSLVEVVAVVTVAPLAPLRPVGPVEPVGPLAAGGPVAVLLRLARVVNSELASVDSLLLESLLCGDGALNIGEVGVCETPRLSGTTVDGDPDVEHVLDAPEKVCEIVLALGYNKMFIDFSYRSSPCRSSGKTCCQ
jgi:hypothetical protein